MSENEAESWKAKYYAGLEELEQRERQWRATDERMRQLVGRLTLAAENVDDELTRLLTRLREAMRQGTPIAQLTKELERIDRRIQKLDELRPPSAQLLLEELFETLQLPAELSGEARVFQKKLANSHSGDPYAPLVKGLGQLINRGLGQAEGEEELPPERGLFGRLLGGRNGTAEMAPSPPATGDGIVTARALLGRIVDSLLARGADLEALDHDLRHAEAVAELEAVADAIAGVCGGGGASVEEALLQLLERLDLPAEQQPRVEVLKERLNHGLGAGELGGTVAAVADLVSEMRAMVQREKAEMESFLKQVTEHLMELDRNVKLNIDSQRASLADGGRLNEAVEEQMQGIANSMEQAQELEVLKESVQRHMETIRSHLENFRGSETERLQQAEARVSELTSRLQQMEGEAEQLRERIEHERRAAQVDPLTEIPNRLAYNERLAIEEARWRRYDSPLCVAVWDVDKFKVVNDSYGHQAGDKVLCVIAKILSKQVRETDFVARFGGEEFVLILPETNLEHALQAAEKLRERIAVTEFHHRGVRVPITISCGVAQFHPGDDSESVFARADKALYRAKEGGRNRCQGESV